MSQKRARRVVIVGAGIAGPVLGMWLRQLGMAVVIVEGRASARTHEGAFLGVAPNGMYVLEALGIAQRVAAKGHVCRAFDFVNKSGHRIGRIDRSRDREHFGWPLTMIHRGHLHAVLTEQAERQGVVIHFGKRVSSIDRTRPNEVVAVLTDGSEVSGDILIGSDGLRSIVRARVLPDAPAPTFSGLLDYGGFAPPLALPFEPGINEMVFGRRAFFGAFTAGDGQTWWFHNGPVPAGASADQELSVDQARERLLELHREDPPWIGKLIRATPEILGAWPIYELGRMPRWSEGRVCLLGDAAHAMSPSAGQGASLAMEDAMILAQCLRDIDDPAQAFLTFEHRRRPRVDAIFQRARRNSNRKAMPGPVAEWLRDRILPWVLRLGASSQSESYAYRVDWEQRIDHAA